MTETLRTSNASPNPAVIGIGDRLPMVTPHNAWRILRRRTGVPCGRTTFYRWISCGKILTIRLEGRIFIPWSELERVIKKCGAGERL